MMKRVSELKLDKKRYKWAHYSDLDMREASNKEKMICAAKEGRQNQKLKKN
ncbi:MAG: hypothetical protein IPJ13_15375 [Saprospiraceae bacterium]|nr:hypothetical protein [Saprospiraceae bacterium]